MPQWRKLHVKATESLDIHEMPDDFTRLLWVMLPLALDQHGRGIDSTAWVKAKTMPLRDDVDGVAVAAALIWYADRGMIERYHVNGRRYFWIPTWYNYQGNTKREADSIYPAPPSWLAPEWVQNDGGNPPDNVSSNSRPTQEPVVSKSSSDVDVDTEVDSEVDTDTDAITKPATPAAQAPQPQPSPPKSKKPSPEKKSPLTVGCKEFLRLFSARRFANNAQREAVVALEHEHGTEKFTQAATWAAERGMSRGKAIAAMRTALPKWGQPRASPGGDGKHEGPHAGILEWMESKGVVLEAQ